MRINLDLEIPDPKGQAEFERIYSELKKSHKMTFLSELVYVGLIARSLDVDAILRGVYALKAQSTGNLAQGKAKEMLAEVLGGQIEVHSKGDVEERKPVAQEPSLKTIKREEFPDTVAPIHDTPRQLEKAERTTNRSVGNKLDISGLSGILG